MSSGSIPHGVSSCVTFEEMSVQETADLLGIPQATVRTRLFRARALLRQPWRATSTTATVDVFAFAGARCDRIVSAVLARLPGV
jgi:RNA polymerase sigma-70 factor (ECF subfamily)